MPILAPGVGVQGGSLTVVLEAGGYYKGGKLYVPISRSIIYPDLEFYSLEEFKNKVREKVNEFLETAKK